MRPLLQPRRVDATRRSFIACSLDFREWATQRGILYPKLQVTAFKGGLRGMRAVEPLKKGEIAIRLPRSAALLIEPRTKSPDGFPADLWKEQPWFVKLALRLMQECQLGQQSVYAGYVTSLPVNASLPCFWPEADIHRLYYPFLIQSVLNQKQEWREIADSLTKLAPDFTVDKELFLSCLAFVRSRSFSGPYIGSKLTDRIRTALVVLVLATVNISINGVGTIEQTLNAVIAVSTFNLLYDFFLSRSLKVYLLAPAVDFMNHSCRVSCDLSYDYFSDGYSVRLDRDYDKDEQVFISYGDKSNDDLLQYFGFIEKENPNDFVRIDNGMLELGQIFEDMTDVSVPKQQDAVEVYRQGFNPSALEAVSSWVNKAGMPESTVSAVLIKFCNQQLQVLEQETVLEENSRTQLISDFIKEKMSVLSCCLNELKHRSKQ